MQTGMVNACGPDIHETGRKKDTPGYVVRCCLKKSNQERYAAVESKSPSGCKKSSIHTVQN